MITLYETFKEFSLNYENDLKKYLEKFEDYEEINFLFDIMNSYRNEIETLTQHHDFDSLGLDVNTNYKVNSIFKILGSIEDKIKFNETKYNEHFNKSFDKFEEYVKNYIIEPYADYSYLFQRMLKLKIIKPITHLDFAEWLFENNYITEITKDEIIKNRGFRSLEKSSSLQRENNFNNIFNF